ncbi:MAG: SMC-Scp complex subunit ScpB [Bacteroidetes bacterium]|nr:SMC-Scp complex subunit ScpB [Bacteroidota bacterium]
MSEQHSPEENKDFEGNEIPQQPGDNQQLPEENITQPAEEETASSQIENEEKAAENSNVESENETSAVEEKSGTDLTPEPELVNENRSKEAADENARNPEEQVDSTLDGLEEIVKPDDESENEETLLKEEVVDDLAHIIESIIFASDEPLTIGTIKSVLDAAHTFGRVNADMITARIHALNVKYESDGNGFYIIEIANGFQFATRKDMAQWVSFLFKERSRRRLSHSALETAAIIAYKQPITKPEIESIRGVNVDYVLHSLLEKEIVTVVGRAETVGRPLLYGTTQRFLKIFGLKNLEDLPKLREIEEIIKEIKSKGAEESIQLEITAFSELPAAEVKTENEVKPEVPSDNATEQA